MLNNRSLYMRVTSFFLLLLFFFNPLTRLFALQQTFLLSRPFSSGELVNGVVYHFINEKREDGSVIVQLSFMGGNFLERDDEKGLLTLLLHSLFYRSHSFSREQIQNLLVCLKMDVDPATIIESTSLESKISFFIPAEKKEQLFNVFCLLRDFIQSPIFSLEEVEMARCSLLGKGGDFSGNLDYNFSLKHLNDFSRKWIRPSLASLSVLGQSVDKAVTEDLIKQIFSPLKNPEKSLSIPSEIQEELNAVRKMYTDHGFDENFFYLPDGKEASNFYVNGVKRAVFQEKDYCIIDGKILIDRPRWFEQRSNGIWLGGCVSLASVALAFYTFGIGLIGCVPGAYYVFGNYPKDPETIAKMRCEDLSCGFKSAFQKGRSVLTLTPFERRQMFIFDGLEPIDYLQVKIENLLISDLIDGYDLSSRFFKEMFTLKEIEVFQKVGECLIHDKNKYHLEKESLDFELSQLTKPFQLIRDTALETAERIYENNYFVRKKQLCKEDFDKAVESIMLFYKKGELNVKERDRFIEEAKKIYQNSINASSFKKGLKKACDELEGSKKAISDAYQSAVLLVQESINYFSREKKIMQESVLVHITRNMLLIDVLENMDPYDCSFSDVNDLRVLR